MIDALFGSKTRVKLLHLFLNNPGTAFYVREITRLIDEQINSVRRELSNMLNVGVITSQSADNKLYYEVDQGYEHYEAFRAMFVDGQAVKSSASAIKDGVKWHGVVKGLPGIRVAVAAGSLVPGSPSKVDLLLAGSLESKDVKGAVAVVEKTVGREITYTMMPHDEFYYRLSVRDRFVREIMHGKHAVIVDVDDILKEK